MSKVAICLSGQLRMFETTKKSLLDHIVNPLVSQGHEVKFFAHFPYEENYHSKLDGILFNRVSPEIEPELDEKNYHTNHYIVHRRWNGGRPVQTYLRQLRSIYMANIQKIDYETNNSITFNWVIRTRFDNMFLKPIEDLRGLDNTKFYIPKHDNWSGYNDRFCFSNSENMDYYANRWHNIDPYFNEGRTLHPETFLKWWLDKANKGISRTNVEANLLRYNEVWPVQKMKENADILD